MNCRTESERFFLPRQGGRDKIAAGVAKATSRTILARQHSQAEKKPLECKSILLDALSKKTLYQIMPIYANIASRIPYKPTALPSIQGNYNYGNLYEKEKYKT
jgi:hypothetical protein